MRVIEDIPASSSDWESASDEDEEMNQKSKQTERFRWLWFYFRGPASAILKKPLKGAMHIQFMYLHTLCKVEKSSNLLV